MSIVVDRVGRGVAGVARLRRPALRMPEAPHLALLAVSLVYVLLIIWRTPQALTLTYDEVVYASQVADQAHATRFTAHRARGMTLLLAPIVSITEWVFAFRIYLTLLAGAFMYVAFRPWLAVFGRASGRWAYVPAVAAAGFGSLWISVLYGMMAYPNIWLAFALVAAVGYFCRAVLEPAPGWGSVAAVAVAFAAASLIRPTDALLVAGPLLVAVVVVRSWRRLWPPAAVVAGVAVGWAAWIVEAFARFDGPAHRWDLSSTATGGGLANALPVNLDALDGPVLLCSPPARCEGVEPLAAVWWFALPVLVVIGLAAAARARWRAAGVLATTTALAVAGPYLFYLDYTSPRFLLPAYGLLALPAAGALIWLTGLRHRAARTLVYAVAAVAFLLHSVVQVGVLTDITDRMMLSSYRQAQRAEFLREQGVQAPCLYWGHGAIEQSYQLKCRSELVRDRAPTPEDEEIQAALARGDLVVVVLADELAPAEFMAGWRRIELPGGALFAYLSR